MNLPMVDLGQTDTDPLHTLIAYSGEHTFVYRFTASTARKVQQVITGQILNENLPLSSEVAYVLGVHLTMIEDPEWILAQGGVPFHPRAIHPVKHLVEGE